MTESTQSNPAEFDDEQSSAEKELEAAEPESVESQEESLMKKNADLEDRLARTQAELVNYRRRVQNEMDQFRKYEGINLVRDMLPVIDNLKRAVGASEQASNAEDVKKGVEMVIGQMIEVLSKYSVEQIAALGVQFDPNLHDAVQQIPSEDVPAMEVVEELETGYKMHDRIVRPSKVIVSTGSAGTEAE